MISEDLKAAYNRNKWGVALRGVFGILIGITILARPMASTAALALVVAIWALVEGLVAIIYAIELRSIVRHWWALLLAGVVSILFGIAALYYYPALSLLFVVAWVGWWLLSAGAITIWVAVQEKKIGASWGWTMAWGILAIAAGVLAFVYPGVTLAWVMGLLAAVGIIGGILRLIAAFRMQSVQSELRGAVRNPVRT